MYKTTRLILRKSEIQDLEPFAAMSADPVVMEYFPSPYSLEQSETWIRDTQLHHSKYGYGVYVISDQNDNFIGITGLRQISTSIPT